MSQSNKVYINPKFSDLIRSKNVLPMPPKTKPKSAMHINPLFAFHNQQLPQNVVSQKPRIHVNPNFLPAKNIQKQDIYPKRDIVSENSIRPMNVAINPAFRPNTLEKNVATPLITATRYTLVRNNKNTVGSDTVVSNITTSAIPQKTTNTIKINKYKSVKIEQIKKNINSLKSGSATLSAKRLQSNKNNNLNILENPVKQLQHIESRKKTIKVLKPTKSRYCLVRCSKYLAPHIEYRSSEKSAILTPIKGIKRQLSAMSFKRKYNLVTYEKNNDTLTPQQKHFYKVHNRFRIVKQALDNSFNSPKVITFSSPNTSSFNSSKNRSLLILKKIQKSSSLANVNKSRGKFNKNNIPCPLFGKYGKCLRNMNGNCKFLHDKKHVAICSKFLKGICHDEQCLFSHDITSKKMPTCYHYLRGMCTKDNCPYLHVKLNENTKICTDFARGFCEKGENCLYRHINVCPNFAMTGKCSSKSCSLPHRSYENSKVVQSKNKTTKLHIKEKKAQKIEVKLKERTLKNNTENIDEQNFETADIRYYKDAKIDMMANNEYETIKPIRVKLGSLPSFIQL